MFDNSRFFVGIVKDNDDTHRPNVEDQRQGKVQVRILGIHDILNTQDDNEGRGVDDKDLPWCACLMPNIFGGVATQGTVPNPSLQIGAWVFGVSLDETYQNNIILGIICLPQNMSPSSVANAQFGQGYAGGGALAPVNLSSTCLDIYEYGILGVESGTYIQDYDWEKLRTRDDLNAKATEGRKNIVGLFQVELKEGTGWEAYEYALRTGKIQVSGLTREQVNQKLRESAEFNIICGRAMCEKKLAEAKNLTDGSGSLMYAAGLYNVGIGNFKQFISNLKIKHGNLASLSDDTIAQEYSNFFKGTKIGSNHSYLMKLKNQIDRLGGSKCFDEARNGGNLNKIPEGIGGSPSGGDVKTGNEFVDRTLQEFKKLGPMHYDQNKRTQKGFSDCSSLMYKLLYAQGLIKNPMGNTGSLGNDLLSSGNFVKAGTVSAQQLNDNYLNPGDIIVRAGDHTEMYIGNGRFIAARQDGADTKGFTKGVKVHNTIGWKKSATGLTVYRRK